MPTPRELLATTALEIEGLLLTAIVGMDGFTIAEYNPSNADSEAFAAKFAIAMSLMRKTGKDVEVGELVENLVEFDNAFVLTRFIAGGQYFLAIAASRETTIGNVRVVARKFSPILSETFADD